MGPLFGRFVVWNSTPVDQACHSSWTAVTKTEALWAEKVNLYPDQVNTGYSRLEGAARGQPAAKWMIGVLKEQFLLLAGGTEAAVA